MPFDWITWSTWLLGLIVLLVWTWIPIKELKKLLAQRKVSQMSQQLGNGHENLRREMPR
jgi:hypothetical protein